MPAIVFIIFIGGLFWAEFRSPANRSGALWVPVAWMFLAGSRYVSSWLNLGPTFHSASELSEGSPIDAAAFFSLILAGCYILSQRKIQWDRVFVNNIWIVLYFAYTLSSMGWSDEPFVLAKRWIKDLGNPIMALVILTEPRPYESLGVVVRRLAYLWLPLSVLFIRYYPWMGRDYQADGSPMYTGVGHQKNDLGLICLIVGIYGAWELLRQQKESFSSAAYRDQRVIAVVLLAMLLWLLRMSDSQTSVVCLSLAIAVLLFARMPAIRSRPNLIIGVPFGTAFTLWALNEQFSIKDSFLAMLGRNPTLTNRTQIWETLRNFEVNPLIGAGFMSFWSGDRLEVIWKMIVPGLNQAHNGYLEQYLNLGYIGVGLIIIMITSALLKIRRQLAIDHSAGVLRLAIVAVAILYNVTEASFYGINNMWLLFLFGCLEVPYRLSSTVETRQRAHAETMLRRVGRPEKHLLPATARRRLRNMR